MCFAHTPSLEFQRGQEGTDGTICDGVSVLNWINTPKWRAESSFALKFVVQPNLNKVDPVAQFWFFLFLLFFKMKISSALCSTLRCDAKKSKAQEGEPNFSNQWLLEVFGLQA